jgi:hypothetical protein
MIPLERQVHRAPFAGLALLCLATCSCGTTKTDSDGGPDAGCAASGDGGAPSLTNLAVSGAGTLYPSFSPGINDYYVTCAAGTNNLTVSMTAAPGSMSMLVDSATLSPSSKVAPTQTVSVSEQPNDAIVAVAQSCSSKAETQYWVRCLPPDFTPVVSARHADAGALQPGYYLAGNLLSAEGSIGLGYAMILDQYGVPVWYFAQPDALPVLDVEVVVPGSISFSFQSAPTNPLNPIPNNPFTVVNPSDPTHTTTLGATGYNTDNHELLRTADGNYVTIFTVETKNIDLTGLNYEGALGPNSTILDCGVVEFEPSGNVVFAWKASDHLSPADVTTWVAAKYPEPGGNVYDVFHCNSVDIDPSNGNYLVSFRQADSIAYVEGSGAGRILWKLGGPPHTLDSVTQFVSFANASEAFHGQHDARLITGWEPGCHGGTGQISVFDDETAPSGTGNARGAVYNVVVGGSGTTGCTGAVPDGGQPPSGEAKLVTSYPGVQSSLLGGNVRFYEGGSRVVGWGLPACPTNQLLTEYDANGNALLNLNFASNGGFTASYRGLKIPLSTFDINTLRKTAGQ